MMNSNWGERNEQARNNVHDIDDWLEGVVVVKAVVEGNDVWSLAMNKKESSRGEKKKILDPLHIRYCSAHTLTR